MKETKSPRIISDPKTADTLLNPITLRQLEPFLGEAKTVSEAAQETQQKANTVLARVKRFVTLGLLEVAFEEKRGGRAVKHYRSVADMFFVPYEASTAESLERMMKGREQFWESLLRRNVVRTRFQEVGTWGTRIYKDERGRLQIQSAITPDKNYTMLETSYPAVLSAWRDSVYLDYEDAKTLQNEMFNLLKRYTQKRGAQRYIVRLGLAPLEK